MEFPPPPNTLVKFTGRQLVRPLSLLAVGGGVAILLIFGHFSDFEVFVATTIAVYAIAALGQDWLIGQTGQVSLGGAAFMAVGAFTVAGTTGTPLDAWPLQIALAAALGALLGFVVGLPALRLGGLYLLMSTLALEYIMLFVTNQYQGDRVAGFVIGPPRIGSWQIQSPRGLLGFVLVILAALTLFQHNVQRRAPGRYWRSIRESDLATASIGIPVVRWKLLAFVWSSAVTAVAGALFAWVLGLVVSNIFSFQLALTLALMVFLGGRATISGPILGAAAVTLFPQGLTTLAASLPSSGSVGPWLTLNEAFVASGIYGLALLVVLLAEPDGIVGLIRSVVARVSSPRSRRPQASASSGAVRATRVGDGQSRPSERTVLAVSELTLRYGNGALGVEGLSFTVEPGQIVALVGRNGAGKTSTLRAIAGFPRAERVRVGGVMRIGDQTVRRHDPVSMRKLGVVLVPERDKVFPTLTVAEHLRLTRLPEAEVEAVYERFPALDQLRERRAGLLSGGERQLVALAAATAVHPLLLLVDEPSLGLSPVAIQNLVKELIRLRNETGMSVLLTEQISETLVTMADAVHVLAGGQIMLSGGTEILQHNDFRAAILGGPRDFRNS